MTESEWFACDVPDLMLEALSGKVRPAQLVTFVQQCWSRIIPFLPNVPNNYTVVEQFTEVVDSLSAHDAAIYTSEAALKAARWSPDLRAEQRHQAELLRGIVGSFAEIKNVNRFAIVERLMSQTQ